MFYVGRYIYALVYLTKASTAVCLAPLFHQSALRMLVYLSLCHCFHSVSSPGPDYICLLIACVSIPAVKFNTSLKPSAKPESFIEEQTIKGMLAWSSCWLIYRLANCRRFSSTFILVFSDNIFPYGNNFRNKWHLGSSYTIVLFCYYSRHFKRKLKHLLGENP